jgi:heat shock protein HslJ
MNWHLRLGSVALLLLLMACGDTDEPESEPAASDTSPIDDTSWKLSADTDLGAVELGDVVVTATFSDGQLSGSSGCNRYTTTYTVDGSSLSITPEIAGTRMLCGEPENAVEQAYLEILPEAAAFSIDGDVLTLFDDDEEPILVFDTAGGPEAVAGNWIVTSYLAGDAIVSVVGGVELTADFADGTVSGSTGCNRFTGSYEVAGNVLTIGQLASTLAACESEELSAQEAAYLEALQLATRFEVTGAGIDLLRAGGTIAVTLASS